jgi:hypothetical protein
MHSSLDEHLYEIIFFYSPHIVAKKNCVKKKFVDKIRRSWHLTLDNFLCSTKACRSAIYQEKLSPQNFVS